jgi:L-ascorbate metabolism protein UlaG (beta-lactamase superfamily)
MTKTWSAVAKRSGDTAFARQPGFESGVALRFPPQSKTAGCSAGLVRMATISAICLTVAGSGACLADSSEAAQPVEIKHLKEPASNVQKLLARVTHFTDNDVRFRTTDGVNVFVDPVSWPTDDPVVKSGMVKPDLILITHSHGDHFQPTILQEYLSLNPKAVLAGPPDAVKLARGKGMEASEIKPGQSYTMAGVQFSAVPACFTEGGSHPKANQWVGYVLQLDGASYYVTGDTQPLPEMANLEVDVLLPLLAGCGGNLDQAVKMAELTQARLVVPVHTSGQEATIKKYLAKLPKGVQGAYYKDAKLMVGP